MKDPFEFTVAVTNLINKHLGTVHSTIQHDSDGIHMFFYGKDEKAKAVVHLPQVPRRPAVPR